MDVTRGYSERMSLQLKNPFLIFKVQLFSRDHNVRVPIFYEYPLLPIVIKTARFYLFSYLFVV